MCNYIMRGIISPGMMRRGCWAGSPGGGDASVGCALASRGSAWQLSRFPREGVALVGCGLAPGVRRRGYENKITP